MTKLRYAPLVPMLIAAGALVGCASTKGSAQQRTQDGIADAAMQPLQDLGLMRDSIPPALARITDPYAAPAGPGCEWIAYEVKQLTEVLGPDSDVAKEDAPEGWAERGEDAAVGAAVSAARGAATGWIPARGIVRSLTGASKAEERYLAAIDAGLRRRSYLKGLGEGQKCAPPASPTPIAKRLFTASQPPKP